MKTHFVIPGFLGEVDMRKPVIEGGNFTWGEMLHWASFGHNDIRVPRTAQHAYNIVNLCRHIQPVRDRVGIPWRVTSGYRPEPYNSRAGGVPNSLHMSGKAMDFFVPGRNQRAVARMIFHQFGYQGGIGGYSSWIHIDDGRRTSWGI